MYKHFLVITNTLKHIIDYTLLLISIFTIAKNLSETCFYIIIIIFLSVTKTKSHFSSNPNPIKMHFMYYVVHTFFIKLVSCIVVKFPNKPT